MKDYLRDFLKFVYALIIIGLIYYFIYPTPFVYTSFEGRPMKVNRVTGETWDLKPLSGWNNVTNPEE